MKLLYKPFEIIASAMSARLGRSMFRRMWAKVDDDREPPEATTAQTTLPKVLAAAALEAATMAAVSAAVDRGSAKAFHYLTGVWPGEQEAKKVED